MPGHWHVISDVPLSSYPSSHVTDTATPRSRDVVFNSACSMAIAAHSTTVTHTKQLIITIIITILIYNLDLVGSIVYFNLRILCSPMENEVFFELTNCRYAEPCVFYQPFIRVWFIDCYHGGQRSCPMSPKVRYWGKNAPNFTLLRCFYNPS